jgi:hypothetical protein
MNHYDIPWIECIVEPLARKLAATKMGLVKDPSGERLPRCLWIQCELEARKKLGVIQ